MAINKKIAKIETFVFNYLFYFQYSPVPALSKMSKNTAAYASNPTTLGRGLMNAAADAFADTIRVFVNELRKAGFHDAADALASFDTPQQRLVHYLFRNNSPKSRVDELAMHVTNVAEHSTAEVACDALEPHFIVPRKSDLTLPLWLEMASSTHKC